MGEERGRGWGCSREDGGGVLQGGRREGSEHLWPLLRGVCGGCGRGSFQSSVQQTQTQPASCGRCLLEGPGSGMQLALGPPRGAVGTASAVQRRTRSLDGRRCAPSSQ